MNSGFRRQVAENCVRLGYYATSNNTEKRSSHHVRLLAIAITCHGYARVFTQSTVVSYLPKQSKLHRSALLTPLTADFETNGIT